MNRTSALLVLMAFLATSPSRAQVDPRPNSVGIYFDTAGTVNCLTAVPGDVVTAHVLVTRLDPTSGGISGFEMSLVTSPASLLQGMTITLPPTAINVLTPPLFQVGILAPLPYASVIEIMTLTFPYLGGPALIGIGPTTPCSFGWYRCLGVAGANNPGNIIAVYHSSWSSPIPGQQFAYWVAGVNAGPGCPVAAERSSWAGLKELYK